MRKTTRGQLTSRLAVLLVAALCLTTLVSAHPSAQAADPRTLAFGAFPQTTGNQTQRQATEQLESKIGRSLEVVRVFDKWEDPFPDSFQTWLHDTDHTLILSIKPVRNNGTRITWPSIATAAPGSTVDNEMRSWAQRIKTFGQPIYVTFHHEPEASTNTAYGTAADYINAWRHWVDVFRQEGATNVRFMFIMTANAYSVSTSDRRYATKWYPGDAWVDSMGIDAYNWASCRPNQPGPWRTLSTIIEPFRVAGAAHPTKDLWLTEWASWDDPGTPGKKAQWIDQAKTLFAQPAYSQFVGVSYFNSDAINAAFPDCQWWVDTSASSLASYTAMAIDPLWSGDAFGQPPTPVPPVAEFTSSCNGLACTFTDGSTDTGGTVTQRSWDFGDGTTSTATSPAHTYALPGTYHVVLTVTDNDGQTDDVTHDVVVDDAPPVGSAAFRAASSANGSGTAASVVVPGSVVTGDRLVLVVTANAATTATTPNGWTLLGTQSDGSPDMRSWVFTREAAAGTAGSTVTSTLGVSSRSSRILLAYSNSGAPTATSAVAGASTTAHATPAASVVDGDTVVSYWSDKTSGNTGWSLPAQVQSRASSVGTSTGRITAAAGDAVAAGTSWPGASATSTTASAKAIMWTIVVPPAGPPPPNQDPTAEFTSSCNGLTCAFSSTSTDPDGNIAAASWDFGDTSTGQGLTISHTYAGPATYPVSLTVTDNAGATASISHDVVVTPAVESPITFVDATAANVNATAHRVTVPASVQPGDAMILALTVNTSATVGNPTGVTGWRLLGVESNGSMSTRIWTKVATAGNAGATVTVTASAISKGNFVLSAYRGTSTVDPVASWDSSLETTSRTSHTTPTVPVASDRSWVVWYWAHKDNTTTALVPPAGVATRSSGTQTGSGRVTGLLVDTNAPVAIGTAAGQTATAATAASNATMWSIVLAPA